MRYSEAVIDHFERPRNAGALDPSKGPVLSGCAGQIRTGARVEIDLAVKDTTVVDVRFRVFGCPHLIAAASLVTEWVKGRELSQVMELRPLDIAQVLHLPHNKLGLMLILEDALRAAATAAAASTVVDNNGTKSGDFKSFRR